MTLEDYAKQIERLRAGFLFDEHEITENMSPIAEQFFIAALNELDNATRMMKLAHLHLVKKL
jgi:hypothetical protein